MQIANLYSQIWNAFYVLEKDNENSPMHVLYCLKHENVMDFYSIGVYYKSSPPYMVHCTTFSQTVFKLFKYVRYDHARVRQTSYESMLSILIGELLKAFHLQQNICHSICIT